MDTASKILVAGGTLNLALAFLLGIILSRVRMKDATAEHTWLLQSHRVALMEGFMLLALVFAVQMSPLSKAIETTAAVLLVASSVFQDASSMMNWLQRVDDQFVKPRPLGYQLAAINAVLAVAGLGIVVVGVIRGL